LNQENLRSPEVAKRQRENQVQPIDKYGAGLFYGSGSPQQAPLAANSYGATYSNGQARPVIGPITARRPAQSAPDRVSAIQARNENGHHDRIVLSAESRDLRNGASWSAGSLTPRASCQREQGGDQGPAYSDELRKALDALLNGRASLL
jgi:hypothetical protein